MFKWRRAIVHGAGIQCVQPLRDFRKAAYDHYGELQTAPLQGSEKVAIFARRRAAKHDIGMQPFRQRETLGCGASRIKRRSWLGTGVAKLFCQRFLRKQPEGRIRAIDSNTSFTSKVKGRECCSIPGL